MNLFNILFSINIFFINILFISSFNSICSTLNFLKKDKIYSELTNLIKSESHKTIILNGDRTPLKKNFCKSLSELNNYNFEEYTFDSFIEKLPFLEKDKTLIYVNDFLIGNGRILNHIEENRLLHIPETSNLVVLQSDNIESIPLKDNVVVRQFNILQFPKLIKKEIIRYIYDIILLYHYNDDLFLLNWNQYDIEKLDFEKINILLFEINRMIENKTNFYYIHNNINSIIESLNLF